MSTLRPEDLPTELRPPGGSDPNLIDTHTAAGARPRLGRFHILGELGRGGMGCVYLARDPDLEREVAIKTLPSAWTGQAAMRDRFRREAQAAAALDHPHIVKVLEVGQAEGQPFLVMELVQGASLQQRLAGRTAIDVEARRLVPWVEQLRDVARALHCAHAHGLVHRDVKPGNILIDRDGCARLSDFGLARRWQADATQITQEGQLVGTPLYMSPEQWTGDPETVGPACDQYALGAILYEILTGRPPFADGDPTALPARVAGEEPTPPRRIRPGLPRDLETIALKALEKNPERRYASCLDLADDLEHFLAGRVISARPAGLPERLAKWMRRNRALAAVSALALLALGLIAGAWSHDARRAKTARRWAQERRLADGAAALAQGDAQAALEHYQAARLADPGDRSAQQGRRTALLALGRSALASDRVDLADYFLRSARAEGDEDGAVGRGLEEIERLRGRRQRAIDDVLARIDEEVHSARRERGRVAEQQLSEWTLDLVGLKGSDLVAAMLARAPRDATLREVYARVLGTMGDQRAIELLSAWARTASDVFVAEACCDALARLGGERASAVVTDLYFENPAWQHRLERVFARLAGTGPVDQDSAQAWRERGARLFAASKPAEAEAAYDEALRRAPHDLPALLNRANVRRERGKLTDALADLERVRAIAPDHAVVHHSLGRLLGQLHRDAEAVAAYQDALRLDPGNPLPANHLGNLLAERRRYAEALEAFGEAIRRDPSYALAWNNRGLTYRFLGRMVEGLRDFEEARRLEPQSALIAMNHGNALQRAGRNQEALVVLEEAERLDPDLIEIQLNRGIALLDLRQFEAALRALNAYLARRPDDPLALYERGLAHQGTGRLDEAERDFAAAVRLDPDYALAHGALGRLLLERGRTATGQLHLQEFLRLAPQHRQAEEVRALLRRIADQEQRPDAGD